MTPVEATRLDPDLIEAMCRDFERAIAVRAPEGLLRIGSAARGELVVVQAACGRVRFLGDLEYLHVATDASAARRLRARITEARRHRSDLPSISVTSLVGSQLRRLRHTFWLWEACRTGRIASGHDFRPLLPRVTSRTLDLRELNEVLLWRMLKLVECVDLDVHCFRRTGGACGPDCLEMRWVASRQVLDIPTWWLPRRGLLLSGFSARVQAFLGDRSAPEEVKRLVAEAWKVRSGNPSHLSCAEWVQEAARALLWCDWFRETSSIENRFSDGSMRALAGRYRFFYRRHGAHCLPNLGAIAQSRGRLRNALLPLMKALADGRVASAGWPSLGGTNVRTATQQIEWLVAEAA